MADYHLLCGALFNINVGSYFRYCPCPVSLIYLSSESAPVTTFSAQRLLTFQRLMVDQLLLCVIFFFFLNKKNTFTGDKLPDSYCVNPVQMHMGIYRQHVASLSLDAVLLFSIDPISEFVLNMCYFM